MQNTSQPKKLRPKKPTTVGGVMINSRYGGVVPFSLKYGLDWPAVSAAVQGGRASAKVRRALESEFKLPLEKLTQPVLGLLAALFPDKEIGVQ